jgi:hypothetical protein
LDKNEVVQQKFSKKHSSTEGLYKQRENIEKAALFLLNRKI